MVTRAQAITAGQAWGRTEFHYEGCTRTIGPRGGVTVKIETWRSNGACKTWSTRPAEYQLPIKYGFNGPYSYITERSASEFHLAADCPLNDTEGAVPALRGGE